MDDVRNASTASCFGSHPLFPRRESVSNSFLCSIFLFISFSLIASAVSFLQSYPENIVFEHTHTHFVPFPSSSFGFNWDIRCCSKFKKRNLMFTI